MSEFKDIKISFYSVSRSILIKYFISYANKV